MKIKFTLKGIEKVDSEENRKSEDFIPFNATWNGFSQADAQFLADAWDTWSAPTSK